MEVSCNYYVVDERYLASRNLNNWFKEGYICEVTKVLGDDGKSTIKSFYGLHDQGKSDSDVICLEFDGKPLKVFPRNLHKKFPNLRFLILDKCGIVKMSRKDLVGLENLECLCMRINNLKSLPDDLFADMKFLRRFSCCDKLERISSKILEPIEKTLQYANFNNNSKITGSFNLADPKKSDLLRFKALIDQKGLPPKKCVDISAEEVCTSSKHKKMLNKLGAFKASGEFSDFTITFRGKEYKVHKCILAAQSSVFEEIFTGEATELTHTLTKIENFSDAGFESFLDYFYAGELDDQVNPIEMFEVATVFGVSSLQAACVAQILKILDESNALEVFNLSHNHKSDDLKQAAFKVIQQMFPDMDDSFIDNLSDVNYIVGAMREIDARLKKKRKFEL